MSLDHITSVTAMLAFLAYVALGVFPAAAATYLIYFLLTIPLRRNERARLFLDLLQLGLANGLSPESAILGPAQSRDRTLGARFHLLAAYLEEGLTLTEAIRKVPRLLPPQIQAMLTAGERIGEMARVIPACRLLLQDAVSHVRSAANYVVLLVFVVTPFAVIVPLVIRLKILPAYRHVFADVMPGAQLPAFTRLVFDTNGVFGLVQSGVLLLIWIAALIYLGGPRFKRWVDAMLPGLSDRISYAVPWRRKRLHRDFSSMLALLLDGNVPEAEAVRLAGEATANGLMVAQATRIQALLKSGVSLAEAIRILDKSGELQWRLSNAMRGTAGFARSLAGWHESLNARAFQLEQAAAQIATTLLVLFNGAVVAAVVIGIFLALISLLHHATLW